MAIQRYFAISIIPFLRLTHAFNPSWGLVPGLGIDNKWFTHITGKDGIGSWGRPHEAMTNAAITSRYGPYFGLSIPTKSMRLARDEVVEGSKAVDHHDDKEAGNPICHFDDESFFKSNERLRNTRIQVVSFLKSGQVAKARHRLGRAIHTLQDFYSHSNWVELGFTKISERLGRTWPLELPLADTATPTCRGCTYPSGLLTEGLIEISADDNCRAAVVGNDPMTSANKEFVFTCMHFAHVNPICDKNLYPDFVKTSPKMLTSGYFGSRLQLHANRPSFKCSHGGPFDRDATGREGISKDTNSPFMSPHHHYHEAAAKLAELATIQYLDDLKDDLCKADGSTSDQPTQSCTLLKLLYGVGSTLSFAIDTTGSMGSVIAGVRSSVLDMVNDHLGTFDQPVLYTLVPFGSASVPAAQTFTDPSKFIEAIQALTASNGDGCPTLAMGSLRQAIGATSKGGQVNLWTDAEAKDAVLASYVVNAAKAKSIQINVFQFSSDCSKSDGFDIVTSKTGGHLFSNLSVSDAGVTVRFATQLVQQDIVELLRVHDGPYFANNKRAADHTVSFRIPVDSTISLLGLLLSGSGMTMSLTRPDGSLVVATDPGVTQAAVATGMIQTIQKPTLGMWEVTITGSNTVSLSIFSKSTIQFSKFDFIEFGGSHHEGFFKVRKNPISCSVAIGHGIVDGGYASATFELRSLTGNLLGGVNMYPGSGNGDFEIPGNYYYGNMSIPNESFNVYVTGVDSTGVAYQRVLPGILDLVPQKLMRTPMMMSENLTKVTAPGGSPDGTGATVVRLTSAAATTNLRTTCPTCQPTYHGSASTTITRTVIYYISRLASSAGTVTFSISTVTTAIELPCDPECTSPLPATSALRTGDAGVGGDGAAIPTSGETTESMNQEIVGEGNKTRACTLVSVKGATTTQPQISTCVDEITATAAPTWGSGRGYRATTGTVSVYAGLATQVVLDATLAWACVAAAVMGFFM